LDSAERKLGLFFVLGGSFVYCLPIKQIFAAFGKKCCVCEIIGKCDDACIGDIGRSDDSLAAPTPTQEQQVKISLRRSSGMLVASSWASWVRAAAWRLSRATRRKRSMALRKAARINQASGQCGGPGLPQWMRARCRRMQRVGNLVRARQGATRRDKGCQDAAAVTIRAGAAK
jgi:hypothetical protein